MKTHNLAPGDFPEIQSFANKLNDVKFSDFANFSQRQIDELDIVLNVEIPKLMSVRLVEIVISFQVCLRSNVSLFSLVIITHRRSYQVRKTLPNRFVRN